MSSKRSIVILGGGITGLAAAWNLRNHDVMVMESSPRLGGWIQTIEKEGFLFETGPRSCRSYGSGAMTLKLIDELGLTCDIIPADPVAGFRYLYQNKKLTKLPSSLMELICSPYLPIVLRGAIRDLMTSSISEDCSIADFITKRLGRDVLDMFVNPLVSGVYAGVPENLSMEASFSALYNLQKKHGSLLKGMILSSFQKNKEPKPKFPLFTLKRGLGSLVERLEQQLGKERFKLNSRVISVKQEGTGWKVGLAGGDFISCEKVISTLPGKAIEQLWGFKAPPAASVAVVNLGYNNVNCPHSGFGYLIPQKEKESILGVVWDSKVFPGQQANPHQTRMTVMIGGAGAPPEWRSWDLVEVALEAVKRQMGVAVHPDVTHVTIAEQAIPQFEVGYSERLKKFLHHIQLNHNGLQMGGAYIDGVAVNECIQGADKFTKIGIHS